MKVVIGSKNPTKISAVQDVFQLDEIVAVDVPTNVSAQPFSDEETKEGAINRALHCGEIDPNAITIGLEGGVTYVDNQLYLCNWGALVTPNKHIYAASGAKVLLPEEIDGQLKTGMELGDVMDIYVKKKDVRKNEGAIGIFTNGLISRKEMFHHVVLLLKGQWEYWETSRKGSV